ncbi:MAG: hypothetical protein V7K89_29565 [Nostoc sp.]|uniref:hypothetical protein n=1 Tax=Nostoc sp. TaxID=1180 RepID=UPI002FFA0D5F
MYLALLEAKVSKSQSFGNPQDPYGFANRFKLGTRPLCLPHRTAFPLGLNFHPQFAKVLPKAVQAIHYLETISFC